jgi:hypothetical protein
LLHQFITILNPATDNIFRLNTKNPAAAVSLIDESLDMNADIRCELVSCLSSCELSLALLDKKQNKFLALEVFQQDFPLDTEKQIEWISSVARQSIILKNYPFRSARVAIVNELTTLIPSALYREEDQKKYVEFNFDIPNAHIRSEQIHAFDAVNIYAFSEVLSQRVGQLFNTPVIYHHTTALLQGINPSFKKRDEKRMCIHVRTGFVDIVVTAGKKLIFINSFRFTDPDDLVYYVLFVSDRLQLNPEQVMTTLAGAVKKESSLFQLLYKYIRNLDFNSRPEAFNYSYVFNEAPAHHYFNLFSLALCES